jgi:ABC-type histidine transport system ATPase subunit
MSQAQPSPILEVRGVVKHLGGAEVLKGVSFNVAEGSVVAIIGASGSGKSTLLRCLNMLVVPDGGEIIWRGQPVGWKEENGRRIQQKERELLAYRTEVGMVSRISICFPT